MRCTTCNDRGYIESWRLQSEVTIYCTATELSASAASCLLCAAIWHGMLQFPTGRETVADPRPINIRLGYWKNEMFRVRYGRPVEGAGKAHLDPAFALIRESKFVSRNRRQAMPGTEPNDDRGEGVFTFGADEGLETIPWLPAVSPSPISPQTWFAITKQIQDCRALHIHSRGQQVYVPDRLVDLGPRSSDPSALLLDDTSKIEEPYVALSHCWGGTIPYRTLQSNKAEMCRRIDFTQLPRNFQDAFTVARWLSYRYIWIDSFCIIQDDPDDWLRQAAKMADVYSGAQLTISATRSSSFDEGFLTNRKTDIEVPLSGRLPMGTTLYARDCGALETTHQGVNRQPSHHTPLFQRAWAFQERLLSQRVLHFLESEVIFECEKSLWCECGEHDTYPDSKYDKEVYHSSSWEDLVKQYTSRSLTCMEDTLPAISALARDHAPTGYIAGLMVDSLDSNLLWRVRALRDLNGDLVLTSPLPTRPSMYVAPSFSWASIKGQVEWVEEPRAGYNTLCKLEDFATTLQNKDDPFGRVLDGYISLRGPTIEVKLRSAPKIVQGQLKGFLYSANSTGKDVGAIFDTADIPLLTTPLKLITIREERSWFNRNNGLVLQPSSRVQGAFERIGCYWGASKKSFEDSRSELITIL
ncbi:heterokaryon incompatibility protein-domain-containing protein [Xylaria sp. FL1777]|nr:heterokaryon incompatibility protein-domain-containing protein [Xylaria sp. FL1777]